MLYYVVVVVTGSALQYSDIRSYDIKRMAINTRGWFGSGEPAKSCFLGGSVTVAREWCSGCLMACVYVRVCV